MLTSTRQIALPRRLTLPSTCPVSMEAIKRMLGFEDVDDLSVIQHLQDLQKAATEIVEADTQRAFISGDWTLTLDRFPCGEIELRVAPVASVTSVQYYDDSNSQQTLDVSFYQPDIISEPARIIPVRNQSWPMTCQRMNAVTVTFISGYPSISAIPQRAKEAIKLKVRDLYYGCQSKAAYDALIGGLMWAGGV